MQKKNKIEFLKTTVIGGIVFLIPISVLILILGEAIDIMLLVAGPLADLLPIDTVGGVALANLFTAFGILLVCFVAGLIARQAMAGRLIKKLETKVLMNIPGYTMIKGVTSGMNPQESRGMKPVLLTLGNTQRIGLEIEKLKDGRSVIYTPSTPNPLSGITQIVPAKLIEYLDVPVMSIMDYTEKYSRDTDKLLSKLIKTQD